MTEMQKAMMMTNKCGDCVFLEKEDGFPYCVTLPLYTERDPDHEACEYFVDGRADDGKNNCRYKRVKR